MTNKSIPWVEKYRPINFDNIVLDTFNKQILQNIIDTSYFPNLLLYGPPGTGKTTTIINLINAYQTKLNQKNKGLIIHLNASDERGIDIIRNQINQFVNSKSLFITGMKFIILDEVDYMTKNAQQALQYLVQTYSKNVRFCLMCNYISRIDISLQNEFLKLRFNQLPKDNIIQFLENIIITENLNITPNSIQLIQKLYKSDIRSMINFIQSNQNKIENNINIIDNNIWNDIYNLFIEKKTILVINNYIQTISINYNIDKKNIIKDFINFIIRNKQQHITSDFLLFVENIMHFQDCNNTSYINYAICKLSSFLL